MIRAAVAVAVFALAACSSGPRIPPWSVGEGMAGPESACVDPATGIVYVSQVEGEPTKKDGKGRISKLTATGQVLAADWVKGLNAPKGLRLGGGILWAADIDEIVGVETVTGKIAHRVKVEGAMFLNDVAVGADGTVYVSDMMLSRLYALKDGKVSVFADGDELEYPNGLLVEGGSLIVGGWGKPSADFSTPVPGRLFRLDLATKRKTLITPAPVGNLDGVESDGKGGWVVTDWLAGKVLHVSASGAVKLLIQGKKGTADHAYLPAQKLLILPEMLENRTSAHDLSALLP
jgi:sugar lactone lactonase YvrE